jgi:hypothetical protein
MFLEIRRILVHVDHPKEFLFGNGCQQYFVGWVLFSLQLLVAEAVVDLLPVVQKKLRVLLLLLPMLSMLTKMEYWMDMN